jgi:hypothetical protein
MMYEKKPRKWEPNRRRFEAGRASDYIKHAVEELRPGDRVVLCCRVSACTQDHNRNLQDQAANLRERAEYFGVQVIWVKKYVGSGIDPDWLAWPAWFAKGNQAKLFAETTDRFIRHLRYHSKTNPDAQARDPDLQDLQLCTQGVTLVTDLHPDASPREARSYHRKRGQKFKGNHGGRPPKRRWKKRRQAWLQLAREMRDAGLSYRKIADRLNARGDGLGKVCHKTVYNWLKKSV